MENASRMIGSCTLTPSITPAAGSRLPSSSQRPRRNRRVKGRELGRETMRHLMDFVYCQTCLRQHSESLTEILGRLETIVWGIRFGAYHESLSANTVGQDNNIREQIHNDFLKHLICEFHIHLNLYGFLVDLGLFTSLRVLLLLSLIAIVHSIHCSKHFLCPPFLFFSLFDLLYRPHELIIS